MDRILTRKPAERKSQAKPPPPQTFKPADFLERAKKQMTLAKKVISCHEVEPTGFRLQNLQPCRVIYAYPVACRNRNSA